MKKDPGIERSYDQWLFAETMPDMIQTVTAFKHLELYIKGKAIGDPLVFQFATGFHCILATVEIAETVSEDVEAPLRYRVDAMSWLIILSRWSKAIEYDIDTICDLLQLDGDDYVSIDWLRLSQIKFARAVTQDPYLWSQTKDLVFRLIQMIYKYLDIQLDEPLKNKRSCLSAMRRAETELLKRSRG